MQPIIDAHAMLGRETYLALDADELLSRMDASGVTTAVARPKGSGLVVDHSAGNDLVLKAGPRIRGLATANPRWGAKALDERIDNVLGAGLTTAELEQVLHGNAERLLQLRERPLGPREEGQRC